MSYKIQDVLEILAKLPPLCGARMPGTNAPIALKRGVRGYWEWSSLETPEAFNERLGITEVQVECMQNGSLFGWDVPAADFDYMTEVFARRVK